MDAQVLPQPARELGLRMNTAANLLSFCLSTHLSVCLFVFGRKSSVRSSRVIAVWIVVDAGASLGEAQTLMGGEREILVLSREE